ncbi:glycerol-3-phosphate responsive antiterminator [Listeria grayi]|uniref:Glycerol uptake operon antiterminator regulatory protein n=2 Tax=Listeria grayi TaxID=1641 RepID=D7UZF5_LISGR|nr:glycerol-3-phosphate responsive antiterminator [Listeria grayi]EFI83720.1 glycerol-3-phosphate responsive antiterminator [Listeria grayi DSM 20601]MBC1920577.1 glycerol-3-phosphate responsive antiterminator [Listeria grayi]STY43188.1 Glycerol-3-phosphate responsive antiterminator [Listeria grayi]
MFGQQKIIPAAHQERDIEKIIALDGEYLVMLETHIAQLKSLVNLAKSANKKVILHADLINGLKNDDYGAEYLCQEIRPAGIVSTRSNVVIKAKQQHIIAIQRLFTIDSSAYTKGIAMIEKTNPDAIELLPGILPNQIARMKAMMNIPLIAGGLIETEEQVNAALENGAIAITTSNKKLWNL